ncbi:Uncharacterized conserved protein YecE, DUF72 family [Aquimarina amphilecti]|uniref:Uncharacterized conserved protein YecE, DUF72 family n=1 Tax=Aquimarina amphilecti TaxID=1038014 RepID=A0A1H7FCM6_AQUAM|nr:DUF72 domain-containing protein [Aquimarina amphilecti]SEK23504.1 Uncharacterized conserved protein YecE, DUF72 family [Aquimarina amphilecti]
MKFGKVEHPEAINFLLPKDHPDTLKVLKEEDKKDISIYVGCAKWNKQDLKGFYPRGTKDELHYYSRQFNCIELNATFYRIFSEDQFKKWYDKTPEGFKFFPKLVQNISHLKRLNEDVQPYVDQYVANAIHLKEKLGTIFLQMHSNFAPKYFDRVVRFVEKWPKELSLAIEFRHTDWFNDKVVANELYDLLENSNVANIITDSAGRRDLLHMRLTNKEAFIRYVGANHETDYTRLEEWATRLRFWKDQGIEDIHFFVHQNIEKESPLLSRFFIELMNKELNARLHLPSHASDEATLF